LNYDLTLTPALSRGEGVIGGSPKEREF